MICPAPGGTDAHAHFDSGRRSARCSRRHCPHRHAAVVAAIAAAESRRPDRLPHPHDAARHHWSRVRREFDETAGDRRGDSHPRGRWQRVRRRRRRPGRPGPGRSGDERVRQRRGDPRLRREGKEGRLDQRRGHRAETRDDRVVQGTPQRDPARERHSPLRDRPRRRRRVVSAARPLGHDVVRSGPAAGDRDGRTGLRASRRPGTIHAVTRAHEVSDERAALSARRPSVRGRRHLQESGRRSAPPEARRRGKDRGGRRTPRRPQGRA